MQSIAQVKDIFQKSAGVAIELIGEVVSVKVMELVNYPQTIAT